MKKNTLFVIMMAVSVVIISACNNTTTNAVADNKEKEEETYYNSDSAVLYYDDYHFNLDTITVGEKESFVFDYTNKGKAPLIVSKVFTSCGCVDINYNEKPLMPNESDSIKLDLTVQSRGYFKKAIVVRNNSINEPQLVLRVEGYAKEKS